MRAGIVFCLFWIDADDLCAVNQVRDLLTEYEGHRPYETEMEMRRKLYDHIGAVTLVG